VILRPMDMMLFRSAEFHCDICHGVVTRDLSERARSGWQPLVVCERCVRDAPVSRIERAAA
jgi:hypothetical protein